MKKTPENFERIHDALCFVVDAHESGRAMPAAIENARKVLKDIGVVTPATPGESVTGECRGGYSGVMETIMRIRLNGMSSSQVEQWSGENVTVIREVKA